MTAVDHVHDAGRSRAGPAGSRRTGGPGLLAGLLGPNGAGKTPMRVMLVHDPGVIALDEPFTGLHPIAVSNVLETLRQPRAAGSRHDKDGSLAGGAHVARAIAPVLHRQEVMG